MLNCIRITRELNSCFEALKIPVITQLSIEHFRIILRTMGYLYGDRELALVKTAFKMLSVNKTVTFENIAMFLNLINNVYLPGEDNN